MIQVFEGIFVLLRGRWQELGNRTMAAVSALSNGRGFRTGGGVPQDPNSWDYTRRSSQEVSPFALHFLHTGVVLEERSCRTVDDQSTTGSFVVNIQSWLELTLPMDYSAK